MESPQTPLNTIPRIASEIAKELPHIDIRVINFAVVEASSAMQDAIDQGCEFFNFRQEVLDRIQGSSATS
jgi:hypothetical protein